MSQFQVKHKARGRYGVLTPEGQWLVDFLGDKEQATEKAHMLNQSIQSTTKPTVVKATASVDSNKIRKIHFVLTKKGWLKKGD